MNTATYEVIPMDVGTCRLGKDHVLGDDYSADDRMEFALVSFLVRGNGRNVLVDLGPKTLRYTNDMFQRFGFFRTMEDGSKPDDILQQQGNVFDNLQRLGVSPQDITDIIFTHLHADHHGMDDAKDGGACEDFPNAVYHFSKIGWDYNIERRVDGHWNSYLDWGFGDCMLRKMAEGRAFAHDDAEIAPGLTTVYLGGHAICSQAIRVETKRGPIIIGSDDFYRYDLMKNGVLARIYTQKEKLIESNGRLADWAIEGAVIIPVHDPVVLELCSKYGENWVEEARRLSREAGEGFRKHWPSAAQS